MYSTPTLLIITDYGNEEQGVLTKGECVDEFCILRLIVEDLQ